MRSKYGARKTVVDGITFDSKREAERYRALVLLQSAGEITDLKLQVPFELLPAQYAGTGETYKRGEKAGQQKMKCIERSLTYIADFVYTRTADGKTVVEDVKGMKTKEYIIKRKLFRWMYPEYEFCEVR